MGLHAAYIRLVAFRNLPRPRRNVFREIRRLLSGSPVDPSQMSNASSVASSPAGRT